MKRKNFIQSSIGALTASYLPALPKFQTIEDEALFVSPAFKKAGETNKASSSIAWNLGNAGK